MDYTALNYEEFEQYLIKEGSHIGYGGFVYEFKFDNNYKAVVMKHQGTLGGPNDLFELVVYYKYNMTNSSPAGNGIKGFLTNEQVLEVLYKLKEL